jgi:hypothetical protein
LVAVAEAIELQGMKSKTKGDVVAAIRRRIMSRKGAAQRVDMIDRSPFAAGATPSAPSERPPATGSAGAPG